MESSRIYYLFERYYQKTCTNAEWEELMGIVRNDGNDEELKQVMDVFFQKTGVEYQLSETISAAMLKAVFGPAQIVPVYRQFSRLAAAVVLLLAGTVIYLFFNKERPAIHEARSASLEMADAILPRGNQAIFTTASGKVMRLDSVIGKQLNADGTTATITGNGELKIHSDIITGAGTGSNTISTIEGGQYSVVLPDGSKVWLNASSSLHFPSVFAAHERLVELSGEGYFEIKKNQNAPFKVQTMQGVQVEVLGTRFNVNAYANELSVDATLLDGAVQVVKGSKLHLLKPGEQAVMLNAAKDNIQIRSVNTDNVVAWKNELFNFQETPLDVALRQLERWYNIDIRYKGQKKDLWVNGIISRNQPLSSVLEMFEYTLNLHHEIEDRRVTLY